MFPSPDAVVGEGDYGIITPTAVSHGAVYPEVARSEQGGKGGREGQEEGTVG